LKSDLIHAVFVVVFGASGLFLMLPHKHGATRPKRVHAVGAGLAGLALLLFAMYWKAPGNWLSGLFFYACAFASIACAALMITARDPIHCALFFAAVVLSTSGLFLLAGASFLAAGTVIVYAGAIIVTFLFVIMLAQMEGRAPYDRAARMPLRATWTCFVLFLGVLWTIFSVPVPASPGQPRLARTAELPRGSDVALRTAVTGVIDRAVDSSARQVVAASDGTLVAKPHVAALGETLYTNHLVTVELAGALLFVALIGAMAIAAPKVPPPTPTRNANPDGKAHTDLATTVDRDA
jgi:NADH-quinone oxidoreductase subunit J